MHNVHVFRHPIATAMKRKEGSFTSIHTRVGNAAFFSTLRQVNGGVEARHHQLLLLAATDAAWSFPAHCFATSIPFNPPEEARLATIQQPQAA
jgi:hypothetical protein